MDHKKPPRPRHTTRGETKRTEGLEMKKEIDTVAASKNTTNVHPNRKLEREPPGAPK